jgi:hypothetical protein
MIDLPFNSQRNQTFQKKLGFWLVMVNCQQKTSGWAAAIHNYNGGVRTVKHNLSAA